VNSNRESDDGGYNDGGYNDGRDSDAYGNGDSDRDVGYRDNAQAIATGDLDGLTDLIDRWCHIDAWPLVVELRDGCRLALQRGKQLWPAAAYAEYRMALDGPPDIAVSVLGSPAERFTLGPFAEVIASTHTYSALRTFIKDSPESGILAHECAIRGYDFAEDGVAFADVLSMPLRIQSWEPQYPVATYEPSKATFDLPVCGAIIETVKATPAAPVEDAGSTRALRELAATWLSESNGRVDVVAIDGDAKSAVATLGCTTHRRQRITLAEAMAHMAWTAASGGAQGRRRGMAAGRQAAWWVLHHLCGFESNDPSIPNELGEIGNELQWYLWDDGAPATGWTLRLAIEDPEEEMSWAFMAVDARM
jgi:hypothetical protein